MRSLILPFLFSGLIAFDVFAETPAKQAVPPADKLQESEKLIKELFQAEYAATDAAGRLNLYAKLMHQTDENKSDPAVVYVLLRESRDVAVLGGNGSLALSAHEKMTAQFELAADAISKEFERLEAAAKTAEPASALVTIFLKLADETGDSGDFDTAAKFAKRAEALLKIAKDPATAAEVKAEVARLEGLKKEAAVVAAAEKTLATKPDDPAAHLTIGRFAFMSGKLEKAFESLAKSSDEGLKKLATKEATPPTEAAEQVALADGWFDRSESDTTPLKAKARERAQYWYETALPSVTGLAKLKIESRLKALRPVAAASSPVPKPTPNPTPTPAAKTPASAPTAPTAGQFAHLGLSPGLMVKQYAPLKTQEDAKTTKVDPIRLVEPIGGTVVTSLKKPFGYGSDKNFIANGFLKIEKPGEYAFKGDNWGGNNMVIVNGRKPPSGENPTLKVVLASGLVPIQVIGFVLPKDKRFENAKVRVQWQPPGEMMGEIPDEILFCKAEGVAAKASAGPQLSPQLQAIVATKKFAEIEAERRTVKAVTPDKHDGVETPQQEWLNGWTTTTGADTDATLNFTVKTDGLVIMSAGMKGKESGNNSNNFMAEVKTRSDLIKAGWIEEPNVVYRSYMTVYWRNCKAGEKFSIRTEKYLSPVVLRP